MEKIYYYCVLDYQAIFQTSVKSNHVIVEQYGNDSQSRLLDQNLTVVRFDTEWRSLYFIYFFQIG